VRPCTLEGVRSEAADAINPLSSLTPTSTAGGGLSRRRPSALLEVVERHFARLLLRTRRRLTTRMPDRLQELVQAREKVTPYYRLEAEEGPITTRSSR